MYWTPRRNQRGSTAAGGTSLWARRSRELALAAALTCLVVAAACGGEDAAEDTPSEGELMSGSRAPTLESMSSAPGTMGGLGSATEPAAGDVGEADGPTFTPLDDDLGYVRTPPPGRFEAAIEFYTASMEEPVTPQDAAIWPADPYGTVGVAIVDTDSDGDLDIYVTNAAGAANSLLVNQLRESGSLAFVDRAVQAGADVTDRENAGVCAGDVDNDGDADLFVVGNGSPNTLLINDGSGAFTVSDAVGAEPSVGGSTCAMGDVDGDGLLDIAVAHTFDHGNSLALVAEPFSLNVHNELLVQGADGTFQDQAAQRGLHELAGVPPGAAGISWGVALVDFDADGDLDLIQTDDQTTMPNSRIGGVDRGLLQVFTNDGSGMFEAVDAGTLTAGTWMGTAWADFDCDANLDMFAGNFGDYGLPVFGVPYELGEYASRWLLGDGHGGFTDPGVGDVGATHFAWGGVAEDFDNDGDPDLLFQGGLDTSLLVDLSNPGTLLVNEDCAADFTWQRQAFSVNHQARLVTGTAAGDLDEDGFVDVVTAASLVVPDQAPLFPLPPMYGLDTDGTGFFTSPFMPTDDGRFAYLGFEHNRGDLVIELNDGNDNAAVVVQPVGSAGLTTGAVVPRSGYGAIVTVLGEDGEQFRKPLQGGTGYLSSDSPVINAGIGRSGSATVEVFWPGGIRNRHYDVAAGSTLLAPEIPCSFDDPDPSTTAYATCVSTALTDLADAGVITAAAAEDALADALRAREER